jgi:lysophospholipase L1-like esterase
MSRLSEWGFRSLARLLKSQSYHRVSQFEALPPSRPTIVMLGDSITDQGMWDEWFPHQSIANRGIGGDVSAQLLARLNSVPLSDATRHVFLLIGTNDLAQGVPIEQITSNIRALLDQVHQRAPQAQVLIQSVMPRKASYRRRIIELNDQLRQLTIVPYTDYIDLWPDLATPEGSLRPEFTVDQLHLNGRGYQAWVAVLQEAIPGLSLPA